MSNARIIAATASAALIAGVGAGAAVYAVEIMTSSDPAVAADGQTEQNTTLATPQDDSTTVYRAPSQSHSDDDDDDDEGAATSKQFQPAPPTTSYNTAPTAPKAKSNTSKSS